jgi:cephalosporin hydroxylase
MNKEGFDATFNEYYMAQDAGELWWLASKVDSIHPKAIIEIGIESGGTLKLWEQLLPANGVLIGVDLYPNISWDCTQSSRNITIVTGNSQEKGVIDNVHTALAGNTPDFVFIDALHTPEGACKDFENYGALVRPGGLVGFHDVNDIRSFFDTLYKTEYKRNTIGTGIYYVD